MTVKFGTKWNDFLKGTLLKDTIFGLDGNDKIKAGADDDMVFGGKGDDKIFGGKGNDMLFGEQGNDVIYGGKGDDHIFGGIGNDVLYGGKGNDTFIFDSRYFIEDPKTGAPYVSNPEVAQPGYTGPKAFLDGGNDIVHGGSGKDTIVLRGGGWVVDIQGGKYTHNILTEWESKGNSSMKGFITNSETGAKIEFSSIEKIMIEV